MSEPPTLLAVHEESESIDLLERLLDRDFLVLRAASGTEALAALEQSHAEVIAAQHRPPGMDGLALMDRVSRVSPGTARVLVPGFSDLHGITEAMGSGLIHAYVVEPLTGERLRDALAEARARHRDGAWRL